MNYVGEFFSALLTPTWAISATGAALHLTQSMGERARVQWLWSDCSLNQENTRKAVFKALLESISWGRPGQLGWLLPHCLSSCWFGMPCLFSQQLLSLSVQLTAQPQNTTSIFQYCRPQTGWQRQGKSSWAHPVAVMVAWQGQKGRAGLDPLHQTHQSEPCEGNKLFWTS